MANPPSGLSSQLMVAEEVTWGTAVTVTRGIQMISETLTSNIDRMESAAIRTGARVLRSADWAPGIQKVAGDVNLELTTKNMALLFKHAMGSVVTAGSGPYTHTLTPGDLTGKGLTVQVGRPDVAGTVQPFTFAGCKVKDWEIAMRVREIVHLKLGMVGKSEATGTALASQSFASSVGLFTFTGATLTIGGSTAKMRSLTLKGDNGLNVDRFFAGQTTTDEPLEEKLRAYGGSAEIDFSGLTAYNRFVNGTEAALVASFVNGANSLVATMNVRYDGDSPHVEGTGLLKQVLPFKGIASTNDSDAISIVVTSAESTP